ncbi:MAG: hypothetical protein AAF621_07385 [Pseudomonadota bacterium]
MVGNAVALYMKKYLRPVGSDKRTTTGSKVAIKEKPSAKTGKEGGGTGSDITLKYTAITGAIPFAYMSMEHYNSGISGKKLPPITSVKFWLESVYGGGIVRHGLREYATLTASIASGKLKKDKGPAASMVPYGIAAVMHGLNERTPAVNGVAKFIALGGAHFLRMIAKMEGYKAVFGNAPEAIRQDYPDALMLGGVMGGVLASKIPSDYGNLIREGNGPVKALKKVLSKFPLGLFPKSAAVFFPVAAVAYSDKIGSLAANLPRNPFKNIYDRIFKK